MDKKIKILGIAPYEGLAALMRQYEEQRQDIKLTAMFGNMEKGVSIAQEYFMEYDLIISRANTAAMISNAVPIPVTDIKIDYYDVLRCIKMAEQTHTRFAFIGFHSLTDIAQTLCDLLQTPIDIFSISTSSEATVLLDKLKKLDYETVICDTVPYDYAKMIGITPILLTSSMESLKTSVDHAIDEYERNFEINQNAKLMRHVLKNSSSDYLVLDRNDQCLFSTFEAGQTSLICKKLSDESELSPQTANHSFFIRIENQMYFVQSTLSGDSSHSYIIFQLTSSKIPLTYSKYGITIMDKKEAKDHFTNSFYSNTKMGREIIEDAKAAGDSDTGIMITGETGTGKDRAAFLYYSMSDFRDHPLYVINCSFINDRSWNFIINHYQSPLTDNGNTIYISNIDRLSEERQKKLLSVILDSNVHVRNHLIFSCTQSAGDGVMHTAIRYINAMDLIVIPMKPMRERKYDIASSAGLYINTLDRTLGKQVVGLENEAIKLLETYDYPYNYTQFKRIIKEAVLKTDTPYIKAETIRELLKEESGLVLSSPYAFRHKKTSPSPAENDAVSPENSFTLNLNQNLNAINKDIVQHVLHTCDGNQTAAAKRLGISRTTLWRYMNNK